jgi:abortive infection bacteriophage resistance protein
MTIYTKPALKISAQIQKLQSRGMVVRDPALATRFLKTCNFYRFGGYAIAYWQSSARPQQYLAGTQFEDVVNLINFDRALRMLTLDAIERLEVAVRSALTSTASLFYRSPHWYLDGSRFKSAALHGQFVAKSWNDFDRGKEEFVKHYKSTYTEPDMPPSWILAEITSFGTWSHLFKNLASRKLRNRIAGIFDVNHITLENNLHVLNVTRNMCAHHARLWNRGFAFKPALNQSSTVRIPAINDQRFAAQAGMIWVMLQAIEPQSHWTRELRDLIVQYNINPSIMRFLPNWDADPFWRI